MRPSRFRVRQTVVPLPAGQSHRRDLCHHIDYRPSSNRQPRTLVSQRLIRLHVASTRNPIFMLGGAPEAYEVSSKTPRVEFQSFAKFLPEAFPIKASDYAEVTYLLIAERPSRRLI